MSQKLFVGGLPFSTSTEELGQLFNQVPGVENVAIVTDRDSGRYFATARGSALECGAVLDAYRILGASTESEIQEGKVLLTRIVSMLTKLIRL